MFKNQAASRHVFDLKVFLLFSWLSSIRFFHEVSCAWTRITALTITQATFLAPLFVLWSAQAHHYSDCRAKAIVESNWYADSLRIEVFLSKTRNIYGKRFSLKIFLLSIVATVALEVINYWSINVTRLRTPSLAWHRVPFPVSTRHVASQADGQGPLSYTFRAVKKLILTRTR